MTYKPNEMMTIAAARALKNSDVTFVGIGMPSAAANLARLTHAPEITLIYESGTLATKPTVLPLSIGDGELCETALTTVSVPEMFRYWLQGGRITVGFLGGAQIDKFANLNTTVVGPYDKPKVRLPGGGGAPEIATSCGEIFIIMAQSKRSFVDKLDFVTSIGHVSGGDSRSKLGVKTKGPTRLITDLAILEPEPLNFFDQRLGRRNVLGFQLHHAIPQPLIFTHQFLGECPSLSEHFYQLFTSVEEVEYLRWLLVHFIAPFNPDPES